MRALRRRLHSWRRRRRARWHCFRHGHDHPDYRSERWLADSRRPLLGDRVHCPRCGKVLQTRCSNCEHWHDPRVFTICHVTRRTRW